MSTTAPPSRLWRWESSVPLARVVRVQKANVKGACGERQTRRIPVIEVGVFAAEPSLEMRQGIQQVLSKPEPSASAERVRDLRSIRVLEYAGTAEAKEHLRTLAMGLPDARLTREGKAALERLAKCAESTPLLTAI